MVDQHPQPMAGPGGEGADHLGQAGARFHRGGNGFERAEIGPVRGRVGGREIRAQATSRRGHHLHILGGEAQTAIYRLI